MYEMKRIKTKFQIELPTCMYQMKPINQHESDETIVTKKDVHEKVDTYVSDNIIGNLGDQIRQCLKGSLNMTDLEDRQENLLKQLQSLRNQLLEIRTHLGLTSVPEKSITSRTAGNGNEIFDDLVINSSPDCIPYGLLALKNAWEGIFNINVTVHSHSSVTDLNQEAKEFQNKIIRNSNANQNCPQINIVLIWKNSEHTEMITSSATYVPIYGEVNVLRYLSRIGPIQYRYENNDDKLLLSRMDAILDISYQLPCCCGAKTKTQLLKILNDHLQKRKYFGGDNWNVADIGAYSALKRSLWLTKKDLTDNLNKWCERIKLVTAF